MPISYAFAAKVEWVDTGMVSVALAAGADSCARTAATPPHVNIAVTIQER
jgi:hypothetical protein